MCVAFEMYFFPLLKYILPCWWLDKALFRPKKKKNPWYARFVNKVKVKVKVKSLSHIVDKK